MSEGDALYTWSQGHGPPRVLRSQSLCVSTGICLFRHCGDRANSESGDFAGSAKRKEDSSRKHHRAPVRAVSSYFNSRSKGKGIKVMDACSPAFPLSALRGPNHQTQLRTLPPPPPFYRWRPSGGGGCADNIQLWKPLTVVSQTAEPLQSVVSVEATLVFATIISRRKGSRIAEPEHGCR